MAYFNPLIVFQKIGEAFRLPGEVVGLDIITNGNINQTFTVRYSTGKSYIFQKVNAEVFKDPVGIMNNIDLVTEHIRSKGLKGLHFHHTEDRKNYVFASDGTFWRVINFVDSITYNTCDDLEVVEKVGRAIGEFQMNLSDFDGSKLVETIPDFHNTEKRLETLFKHNDDIEELNYIKSVADKASKLSKMYNDNEMPIRVTHNDTKCNNILFDKVTKEPLVIIDLDTVMPGMAIYDFADAARFICNDAKEDDDSNLVNFNLEKFDALCRGYLKEVKHALTEIELSNLVLATFSITIELASRFLDDHLNGNKYFKCLYPEHNIVRTRNQIALAKDIASKKEEMSNIVRKYLK